MAQQARAVETRRQIIDGAADLFSRVGFERARLNDIVTHTGLTRGALYFHFESKEDLAHAVVAEFGARSVAAIAAVADTRDSAVRQVAMLCREMGRLLTDDAVMRAGIRLVIDLSSGQEPIPVYSAWLESLKYLVSVGIAEGDVRAGTDPEQAAEFITEAFVGAHVLAYAVSGYDDLASRIDRLADSILWALMPADRIADRPDLLGARLPEAVGA